MKKYINISIIYAVLAMVGGVFFREFTKYNSFEGTTALGKVHVHLFLLGMVVYLLVALFNKNKELESLKTFKAFNIIYNIGVPLTATMMLVRGIIQVLNVGLSSGASGAISGIAGIGHILTGAGIVLLLISLRKSVKD